MTENCREYWRRMETTGPESREEMREKYRDRRTKMIAVLCPLLKRGDKMRATAARCMAHEATFTFDHWDGDWIVSKSGVDISPNLVYSVNGEVVTA